MARADFIYGCPQESWQTIEQTIELMDAIRPLRAIFYILDLFPGTALYDDDQKREKDNNDTWLNRIEDIMYFETDPSLTKDLILQSRDFEESIQILTAGIKAFPRDEQLNLCMAVSYMKINVNSGASCRS